jgi:lysozyme family protein
MTFDESCNLLFMIEGFYSDHPDDEGGATKYGITMESWAAFKKMGVTKEDIKNITIDDAKAFYKKCFWDLLTLDQVNNPTLRYLIFDQAVNRGPQTIVRQIQISLNKLGRPIVVDSIWGPKTLESINAEKGDFLLEFVYASQLAYCNIVKTKPSQIVFLVGWIRRTQELMTLVFKSLIK